MKQTQSERNKKQGNEQSKIKQTRRLSLNFSCINFAKKKIIKKKQIKKINKINFKN
jgi:hypothetical protein